MTVAAIREKLIIYMADADDDKVKALYTLLEDDMEAHHSFTLSPEHIAILDKERELHLNGVSKSYSLQEARQIIRGEQSL